MAIDRGEDHHASLAVIPAGDPERLRVPGKAEDRLAWPSTEDRVEFGRGFGLGVLGDVGEEQLDCVKARGFLASADKFERERDRGHGWDFRVAARSASRSQGKGQNGGQARN